MANHAKIGLVGQLENSKINQCQSVSSYRKMG